MRTNTVVFDHCAKCGSPRTVPIFSVGEITPTPSCECMTPKEKTTNADKDQAMFSEIERARAFDRHVVELQARFSASNTPLTLTEVALILSTESGALGRAVMNEDAMMAMRALVKVAVLARYAANSLEEFKNIEFEPSPNEREPEDDKEADDDEDDE